MKRCLTALFIAALLLASVAPVAQAVYDEPAGGGTVQSASLQELAKDVYIVVMRLDPVMDFEGAVGAASADSTLAQFSATKPAAGTKLNAQSADVVRYANYLKATHDATLQAVGVDSAQKLHDYVYAVNGFAAQMSPTQAIQLTKRADVLMVLQDQMRQVQEEEVQTTVDLALNPAGNAWLRGYNGEGVIVGVIDTGIWPEHPSFADDGSYSELDLELEDTPDNPACNFGNVLHNLYDAPFTCNNKLLGARQTLNTYRTIVGADPDEYDSARDDGGHGTHTASTAAGNADVEAFLYGKSRGTVSGIAPRARIIAYKGLGNLGGFSSDLASAIDQAVADGVDVINYSIGGGPSLTGADDIAFLFAADAGVLVATSAGNSGPGPATIGSPASLPWLTSVGANTQKLFYQGTASSSDGWSVTGASITASTKELPLVDAAAAGDELCTPGALDAEVVAGAIVLCKRGAIGRAAKSFGVFLAGGKGMILYNATDDDNLFSDTHWVPSVHIDLTPGLAIKEYIANSSAPTARITGGQIGTWESAPSMTIFSSRGPNPVAESIIKPDITAPGHQILAGNSPTPDLGDYPSELFQAISGTSMSSPFVAGVFALLKQANPEWSPAVAKSAIMTTAHQDVVDNDRVSPAGPFAMGSGHVELRRANKGSLFQPGLAYDAGFADYLGFLCDAAPEVFANPEGTCGTLAGAGIPTEAINLNYPSIGVSAVPGKISVVRTVTNVQPWGTTDYRVSIDEPEGYEITVTPKRLVLRPGESATFTMEIVNETAPVDEWAFGSITWKSTDRDFQVYSPIAVRGTSLAIPDAIMGSGTEGTASFGIDFGYTGAYTAAAHGLEAATITSDNVLQDPDQTFAPSDVEAGGANVHEFTLAGAAFFRIAMPPSATEADADLDIFVYNPDGQQVASSTSGGTDELIDLVLPADGVWRVYVHGWQAPGGDSDYDLYTWVISATPGGSLNIDSAPTAATLGESGTVAVSWSGLNPGEHYLGAVSHSSDAGLLGLTLVEVDTSEGAAAVTDEINTGLGADDATTVDTEALDNHIFIPFVESD